MSASKVLTPGGKVLISWFSKSGLTKRVVLVVQSLLQADIHEITKGSSALPDFTKYNAFIVACPVWYYKPPDEVSRFLRAADFGGKPVVGLGTCGGSMGGFADAMKKDVVKGRFIKKDGFYSIQQKSEPALLDEVKQWLAGL
jgi:flavodoxin